MRTRLLSLCSLAMLLSPTEQTSPPPAASGAPPGDGPPDGPGVAARIADSAPQPRAPSFTSEVKDSALSRDRTPDPAMRGETYAGRAGQHDRYAPTPPPPSVGRIVHYTPPKPVCIEIEKFNPKPGAKVETDTLVKDQPFAAIITHVNSDSSVNLSVFNDGVFSMTGDLTPTCVQLGTGPHTWAWPPRA